MSIEQRVAERLFALTQAVSERTLSPAPFRSAISRLADFSNRVNVVLSANFSPAATEQNLDELLSSPRWKP